MVTKVEKHIGISDFRRNLSQYFKRAGKKPLVVSGSGNDTRVVVDVGLYNQLINAYEDLQDAECLRTLVANESGDRASWNSVKKEHGL